MDKIRSVGDTASQSLFDFIFPKVMRNQAGLSDTEANTLYTLWKNSPKGATRFAATGDVDPHSLMSLKTKGYLSGFGSALELTEKGKKIIVEMATHEPNAFEKHAETLSYSGIKATTNKRPRQAFFNKQAGKEKKMGKIYNLRRESVLKLSAHKQASLEPPYPPSANQQKWDLSHFSPELRSEIEAVDESGIEEPYQATEVDLYSILLHVEDLIVSAQEAKMASLQDAKILREIRTWMIQRGYHRETNPQEMSRIQQSGGKKYDYKLNGRFYVWDHHPVGFFTVEDYSVWN